MNLYLIGGILAAFIAVGSFAGCEHHNAKVARAERATAVDQRDTAIGANTSNQAVIAAQAKALKAWKDLGKTPAELAGLIAQQAEYAKRMAQTQAENAALKRKDDALPDCVALLAMDYSRACPTRAGILRRYESSHPNDPD